MELRTKSKLNTAPSEEPITLTEAKTQLRFNGVTLDSDDESKLNGYISAARQEAENYTRRAFITQTWELWLNKMPEIIPLRKLPVVSITSVEYYDENDSLQTFASSNYKFEDLGEKAQIHVNDNFPSLSSDREFPVKVTYIAGYGAASTVPQAIKNAIKLGVTNLENDEMKMSEAAISLLTPYRVL